MAPKAERVEDISVFARLSRTVWAPLRRFVQKTVLLQDGARSDDLSAFESWARGQTLVLTRACAVAVIAMALMWWPLDFVIYGETGPQAALVRWRLTSMVIIGASLIALAIPFGRRNAAVILALMTTACAVTTTRMLGDQLGPGRPLLYGLYIASFVSLAYVGPIVPRTLGLIACTAITIALDLIANPELGHDVVAVTFFSMVGFACACATVVGHMIYVPLRQSFLNRRALARLRDELDQRVRQKTADLARVAQQLQLTQEEERARIARELHDELGQRLSALRFGVATTRQHFTRAPLSVASDIAEIDTMIDGARECTRELVLGLRPAVLDKLGLAGAIGWLAGQTSTRAGIVCQVNATGVEFGSPTITLAAYRITQEALTNVVRHSGAKNVSIELTLTEDRVHLEVMDDGRGFPELSSERRPDRNGLLGMRERASAVGGELHLDNRAQGGARIRLTLPISAAAQVAQS